MSGLRSLQTLERDVFQFAVTNTVLPLPSTLSYFWTQVGFHCIPVETFGNKVEVDDQQITPYEDHPQVFACLLIVY